MKTSRILPSSTINRAGVLRGSGLYNSLGRAGAPTLARPSLCAYEALRRTSSGASMTTPGGAHTTKYRYNSPSARRIGFYQGVGASTTPTLRGSGPSLCPRPDALSPPSALPAVLAHNTRRCGHPAVWRSVATSGALRALTQHSTALNNV